ncbi:MAG: primosomal protein N' [Burkholderiales bacterium]|nr:primosomal protein N' [Burkholderiales bacterium]
MHAPRLDAVARVALDVPLPTLFDYLLPVPSDPGLQPLVGRRVRVPFGRGNRIGVIVEIGSGSSLPADRLRRVLDVFRDEPPLDADVLGLLQFATRYYHHPIGASVFTALPQRLREGSGAASARPHAFRLTEAGQARAADLPTRALLQRRLLELLRPRTPVALEALERTGRTARQILRQWQRRGWIEACANEAGAAPPAQRAPEPAPALTLPQSRAVQAVVSAGRRFAPFLLRGVTGSGKTEVYLHLAAACLSARGQALVLVPEIGLTPQLLQRFEARFPAAQLIVLHSELSEAQRLARWRTAQAGGPCVVIGTRLAVFTPLPALGLVVVDEEHDTSYKQQEGLRYSARDLALLRAKMRAVPVLLGSATPSLESYANVQAGRYRLLELPERADAKPPCIGCVDTRRMRLQHGLSKPLLDALRARVERGEQSLVFVNRRGFAPALVCSACGWACPCTRCAARLVVHLKAGQLRCHYCGHAQPVLRACPDCGNQDLLPAGHGTQRIEQALQEALPQARVVRVDRDTTRGRDAFSALHARIRDREVDVLVGTQMLAKGHDFPRLTLVGVINADSSLYSSDFRAAERLYAQLTQVSGRAGRAELPGEVLIQTEFPDHPLYAHVCRQDYHAFAREALQERRDMGFPPFAHQALLRAEAARRESVDGYLQRVAAHGARLGFPVEIYDPVPPPIARVAGRERAQLLVQAQARADLQRFLDAWTPHLSDRTVRWSLDVDPLEY